MKIALVDIHTHQTTCQAASPRAAGVHPWSVGEMSDDDLARSVSDLARAPVDAIGEIGLDYACDKRKSEGSGGESEAQQAGEHGRARQRAAFRAQLALAEARGLPVIVHSVRAFEDTMAILSEFSLPAVVFHGFVGSPEQARRVVDRGWFLSFGVRGFASPRTVEAMRGVPLDLIFLETDDDPTPLEEVYARAAEILKIPVRELASQMAANYGSLRRAANS